MIEILRNLNFFGFLNLAQQHSFTLLMLNTTLPVNLYYFLRLTSVYIWKQIPNYYFDDLDYKDYYFVKSNVYDDINRI